MITRKVLFFAAAVSALFVSGASFAGQPADDDGFGRLWKWESHLDQRIRESVDNDTLTPYRAWELQKQLDDIELQSQRAYFDGDAGIDYMTYQRFAGQLRDMSRQLGETHWQDEDWGRKDDQGAYYRPGPQE